MSMRQLRCSMRMIPCPRSMCFSFSPSTSEIRVPVSRQVSLMSRFGFSRCARTRAVSSSLRMRSGRTFHFFGSLTLDIGLTRFSSMISHSCAFAKMPPRMLRRSAIMYQESQCVAQPIEYILCTEVVNAGVLPTGQDVILEMI